MDLATRRFLRSLPGLGGIAGVWVSEERRLLFTSNRGEDTASVFRLPSEEELFRLRTGARPNGLAFDPSREVLLVAGVGDVKVGAPPTASFFDVSRGRALGRLDLPGRTRWATYHRATDSFLVNIADPPRIAQFAGAGPATVRRFIEIPAKGPHGMEQDPDGRTLYCACDEGALLVVDLDTGAAQPAAPLAGAPDVLWLNPRLGHLYVAVGDPGLIQVFDTKNRELRDTVPTAAGAHTLTVDPTRDEVHVFLPETHEDLVLSDRGDR